MTTQEFIISLFEVEMDAHIAHLQTRSYAQHMALDELYKGIVDLRDSFVELYQGATKKIISGYPQPKKSEGVDMVVYLDTKIVLYRKYRETVIQTEIQQKIDDIIDFIESVNYKLKFLS